ncbi:DUF4040 domain-containing protein [Corticibacter populi]|uniref:DUF4040 domain-containing protein n=1 Tax=Corticibacter populi TaxID=1550736 RepID=A0A3M6QYZ6_9BURK|nr:hydrogen gas-evolving membrane-bound hydrogenase subunit E [Corticibacter populi]RMX08198.1 DUF4040 domain-containing protein [Corticibacter populi]RZS35463.1 multisubunit sodium/proton antiporter MrpA subunit [Corticibacter populi]
MELIPLSLSPWFGAIVVWRLALVEHRLLRYLPVLLPLALLAVFLQWLPAVSGGQSILQSWAWAPSLGVELALRLDGFAMLFVLLITGIGTLVTLYAIAYFAAYPRRERARFVLLIQLFMAAMLGTVLADDVIALFVFWELTSLLSFLLIGFDASSANARKAALQSLLITAAGGLALFAGLLLLGMALQTFRLSEMAARAEQLLGSVWLLPAIVLILLGAFTKSAQFPFHFWLPQAMAAPTPASAYLHSATMVKLGVYLLARFDTVLADVSWFAPTLLVFGSVTMLVAALGALRASQYKAMLAQSTVASLGILVMLIGLDGDLATVALCVFIVAHALYKAALFFVAGTVLHTTHTSSLLHLGGLRHSLPWTAAAAALAGLSMAGLPPWFGFIAKEALFEAQLSGSQGWWVIAVAVMVNAVMVAVAGMVAWRPFWSTPAQPVPLHHGASPGMVIAPLLLAVCGLLAGLLPGLLGQSVVTPAAAALQGHTIAFELALWHGLTPMLGLSALVVVLGLVLLFNWPRCHHALLRAAWLQRLDANAYYQQVVDAILLLARRSTRWLQNGDMRHYTVITSIALVAVMLWLLANAHIGLSLVAGGQWLPVPAALLTFGIVGACVAVRTRSMVAGLVGVGVVGYGSALFFLLHGAPDLALTQFAVETLVLIVLMAVLVRLPRAAPPTRSRREVAVDATIAVVFGLVLFVALASMLAQPFDTRLSDFFRASSYVDAHGRNVVNVIIVDYRALDTMGEIAVVALATLGAWSLLRRRRGGSRRGGKP